MQLERDVGRTITPTVPNQQEDAVQIQLERSGRVARKADPTNILLGRRAFSSPGKSCIVQARCGCLARWHQVGAGDEEQEAGEGGVEHHACGLPPPSTGTL